MDLTQQDPSFFSKKEQKFIYRIEKALASQDLTLQRQLIEKITKELNIELIDCAAALVWLSQSNLYHTPKTLPIKKAIEAAETAKTSKVILQPMPPPKMVRYRIEVGQKHNVSVDEIKDVFVEEAGVDKKNIGIVDIRYYYTLIELPEGMPTDIYHLLTTVYLRDQKLNIKRLKSYHHPYSNQQRKNKSY